MKDDKQVIDFSWLSNGEEFQKVSLQAMSTKLIMLEIAGVSYPSPNKA